MKRVALLSLVALTLSAIAQAQQPFVVHEWGTFTTLAGSDGKLLPGLYHEEEKLPGFVMQNSREYSNGLNKGYYECTGVTVKMETPVIYFYSGDTLSAHVRVDWPAGSISQWYPSRTYGDYLEPAMGDTARFADTARNGWAEWDVKLRAKGADDTIGIWKPGETHTWQAPRATDANVVVWQPYPSHPPQVEKYIFYRGIGCAKFMDAAYDGSVILNTRFQGDTLIVDNTTYYNIPWAFVYELSDDSTTRKIWWSGEIQGAERVRCLQPLSDDGHTWGETLATFREQLVKAGLYAKEADAMIETWQRSYFGKPGLRMFWIVPRMSTDRSLPLAITPTPDSIERVMVARSEILTPAFEQRIIQQFKREDSTGYNEFAGDRYYLAYKARYQALKSSAGVESKTVTSATALYPNPTTGLLTIPGLQISEVTVIDELGREQTLAANASGADTQIDLSKLPAGRYMLRIRQAGEDRLEQVVKQ